MLETLLALPALLAATWTAFRADVAYRVEQGLRGMDRMVNGFMGGQGDCTISAWTWELRRQAEAAADAAAFARYDARAKWIDGLRFNGPGHCERAWIWHRDRGLLVVDDAAV